MVWDVSSRDRRNRQQCNVANLALQNRRRPIPRVAHTSHDESVEQLEAENAELRRRIAELALEIEAFRKG
jgi:hypothetical protein